MTQATPSVGVYQAQIQHISLAQKLTVKAMESKNIQNLCFTMLNDTFHLIPYDRAVLWRISKEGPPKLVGVSGQATYTSSTELVQKWGALVAGVPNPNKLRVLTTQDFKQNEKLYQEYQRATPSTVLWVPIWEKGDTKIVLWLEKWGVQDGPPLFHHDAIQVLEQYLVPGYKAAWDRIAPIHHKTRLASLFDKKTLGIAGLGLLVLMLLIRIPLRIVAPCEVVAVDPYLIAAPLEGIIAQVNVKAGQDVKKGDPLYTFDDREAKHELEAAQKKVDIAQSEMMRSMSEGVQENKSLDEMALSNFKLKKEMIDLNYAKYRSTQLVGTSPVAGVAVLDNPDDWRGKPVKIGEKIMFIANPGKTKVKIWIPEADNAILKLPLEITVFLNPYPEKTIHANLNYISQETVVSDRHIPSFIGEAEWIGKEPEAKLGLKGNAVIYGERVSLLYYVLRKPIESVRRFIGF